MSDKDDQQQAEDTFTMNASSDEDGTEVSDDTSQTADDDGTAEGSQQDPADDPDTFNRAYVEDLRKESAGYRTQVRELQQQLHRLKVEQSGMLADPADLAFDPEHLADPAALTAAIDALLTAKPHLKARRFDPAGAAQGPKTDSGGDVSLVDIMRSRM